MTVRNLGLLLAILCSAACNFDEDAGGGSCVEGQQATCSCTGRFGVQICGPDSSFGRCVCDPDRINETAGTGGQDASLAPADPGNAGGGGAGSSGVGASEAGDGGGGATSAGGTSGGTAGMTSGSGGAGSGGASAGSGGSGGGSGTSGGAGSTAGDGGGGGDGGSGGESGSGGAGSGGGPAEPGDPYSRCNEDTDCNPGLVCAINSQVGQAAGYCTAFCDAMNGGTCPQPTSGTVKGMCLGFANVCILSSCQEAECPDGMQCVQGSMSGPLGGSFYCEYPRRGDG